jgi:hypothetical protein
MSVPFVPDPFFVPETGNRCSDGSSIRKIGSRRMRTAISVAVVALAVGVGVWGVADDRQGVRSAIRYVTINNDMWVHSVVLGRETAHYEIILDTSTVLAAESAATAPDATTGISTRRFIDFWSAGREGELVIAFCLVWDDSLLARAYGAPKIGKVELLRGSSWDGAGGGMDREVGSGFSSFLPGDKVYRLSCSQHVAWDRSHPVELARIVTGTENGRKFSTSVILRRVDSSSSASGPASQSKPASVPRATMPAG